MEKTVNILILSIMLQSCLLFNFSNSSDWKLGPKKGEPGAETIFSSTDILKRKRVLQSIGGYSIPMPENMTFKNGVTTHGQEKILGKRRKFLYDNVNKTAETIYLMEDTIENLSKIKGYQIEKDKNRNRYKLYSPPGILIKIKSDLYLFCQTYDNENFNAYNNCEAIAEVMQGK